MNVAHRIEALLETRFTLWTWIKKFERSKDPVHCKRMRDQMRRELNRMIAAGKVSMCKSYRNKIAYRKREVKP